MRRDRVCFRVVLTRVLARSLRPRLVEQPRRAGPRLVAARFSVFAFFAGEVRERSRRGDLERPRAGCLARGRASLRVAWYTYVGGGWVTAQRANGRGFERRERRERRASRSLERRERFRTSRRMPRCAFSKKKTHTRKTVADSIFSVSSRVPTGADARRPGGGSSARGLEPAPVRTRDARSRRRRVRASETHRDSRRKTPRAFPRERSPAWHDGRYFHHGDRGPLLQRRGEGERGTHGTTTRVSPRAFSRRRPSGARSGSRGSVGATSSSPPLESSQRVSRERRSESPSRDAIRRKSAVKGPARQ